ncbi:MAG TPA: hypothetical protein VGD62_09500 [Acidobacteriaceae bacterium]
MQRDDDQAPPFRAPQSPASPRRRRRFWTVLSFILLGVGVTFFLTASILLHRAMPILRARVINTLSTRFDSRVELPELDIHLWRGVEVTGKRLKLYPHALDRPGADLSDQPIFSVGEFRFRTQVWDLLRSPMYIGHVQLTDLQVYRPTGAERERLRGAAARQGREANAVAAHRNKIEIYVDELLIDRAQLVLGTDRPGKVPLQFNIQGMELHEVGRGQPMRFHATLVNPKPLGNIDSTGYFGPFDVHEPGTSPVRGDYSFSHADLHTIKGIGGLLSSTGRYAGRLDQITVDGQTDTPDFSLDSGAHPMPLHTRFHAIVDGLNGNTYLQPVDAMLLHSHILATGAVTRALQPGGQFGRHVQLDIRVGPGDIADMLRVAVKTQPPVMHGALRLAARLDLPPGPARVPARMHLKGRFLIQQATFTNEKTQAAVDQLSLRSQGLPREANALRKAPGPPGAPIQSDLQGDFTLDQARLTLMGLHYTVPGADVALDGIYSLDGSKFDFHGTARLDAKLSHLVTGWRSLLLKPVDPFFARHGAGTEVPFTITGTRAEPKFGLALGNHAKAHPADPASQPH